MLVLSIEPILSYKAGRVMQQDLFLLPLVPILLGVILISILVALFRKKWITVAEVILLLTMRCVFVPSPDRMYLSGVRDTVSKCDLETPIKQWVFQQQVSDKPFIGSANQLPLFLKDRLPKNTMVLDFAITKISIESRQLTIGAIGFSFGSVPAYGPYIPLTNNSYVFLNRRQ